MTARPITVRPRHLVVTLVLTVILASLRFGHRTPDSPFYLELASYFRGELPIADLDPPYAYRVLTPWLAAMTPISDLGTAFACINIACTSIAYFLLARLLTHFVQDETELGVGLVLLVVSFPTVNYASGVLSDPVGFLFVAGAAVALYEGRLATFAVAVSVGVLARESVVVLVGSALVYLFIMRREEGSRGTARYLPLVAGGPLICLVASRVWLPHAPQYVWTPDLSQMIANLLRPVSWITTSLTALPLLAVLSAGIWRRGFRGWRTFSQRQRAWAVAVGLSGVAVLLYSIPAAFMSGRFFWPLYIPLIPLAVVSSSGTLLIDHVLAPVARALFGRPSR